jgi:hypothetical protein
MRRTPHNAAALRAEGMQFKLFMDCTRLACV